MTVDKFAKEHGYTSTRHIGRWKGYEVHEPLLDPGDGIPVTGIPVFILCRGVEVRMSTLDESMGIMEHFN